MSDDPQGWLVCDREICLYSERSARHLRDNHGRCIKHGALLHPRHWLAGKTRQEARCILDNDRVSPHG